MALQDSAQMFLLGSGAVHVSTALRLKGRCGDLSACSSPATSARWPTGASVALPSFFRRGPFFRRYPRRMVSPFRVSLVQRGRLVLCFCLGGHPVSRLPNSGQRCGVSAVPRLRFDLALVFRAPGGDTSGEAVYLVTKRFSDWFPEAKERESLKLDVGFAPPGFFFRRPRGANCSYVV